MKHLYLMRHAQSTANASQTVSGVFDAPLSDLGRRQAQLAAQNVRRFFKPDVIVTSPLARARQTAEIVAAGLGYPADAIIVMPEVGERDLGDIEGRPKTDVPNQYAANMEDIENVPGQEPLDAFYARLQAAYQKLAALPQDTVLVVAHNGSGRMLKTVVEGGPPAGMHGQARLENGVVRRLL